MTGLEMFGLVLATFLGAVFGGVLGYVKAKKENQMTPFQWWSFLETLGTGIVAGGLWLGAVDWANAEFSIPILIAGVFAGAGLDYTLKKTLLP